MTHKNNKHNPLTKLAIDINQQIAILTTLFIENKEMGYMVGLASAIDRFHRSIENGTDPNIREIGLN